MSAPRHAGAAAVALGLTVALALCSGVPWAAGSGEGARIRLSWRAVGERVEECRRPSEEELAALPPHMRREEICEGRTTPFHLRVSIDGAPVFDGRILPGGARHDRPVYVFREFPVAPGRHRLEVRFAAEIPPGPGRPRPLPHALDEVVELAPGRIALVTLDDAAGRLRVLGGGAPSALP